MIQSCRRLFQRLSAAATREPAHDLSFARGSMILSFPRVFPPEKRADHSVANETGVVLERLGVVETLLLVFVIRFLRRLFDRPTEAVCLEQQEGYSRGHEVNLLRRCPMHSGKRVRSQKAVTEKGMSVKISALAEAKHLR